MSAAGARILVVDDEAAVRLLLTDLLEGYAVEAVESVARALERLEERRFDLVLSDYRLPGPSGLDLAQAIRRRGLDTVVVLMTGNDAATLAELAAAAGVLEVLQKPFGGGVRAVVERVLRRAPA